MLTEITFRKSQGCFYMISLHAGRPHHFIKEQATTSYHSIKTC